MQPPQLSECERVMQQISIFNEIGKTLTFAFSINEALDKIFSKVVEYFHPENWSLLLVDEDKQELFFEIAVGNAEQTEKLKNLRLKIGEGIAGWVARHGRPLFVPCVADEPCFCPKADEATCFSPNRLSVYRLKFATGCWGSSN